MKLPIFLLVVATSVVTSCSNENVGPEPSIEHVTGDLYRVNDGGNYYSALLVTPEGIIAADPISRETATWLEAEVKERFGVPVKYLIYSHSDFDHASGGEVFTDATVVAHQNAEAALIENATPTAIPDISFADRMSLELGGKKVNLVYLGPGHTDNLIAIHFPEERAVLCVDIVFVKRLAYGAIGQSEDAPPTNIPGWIEGLHTLEAIDYDILLTGHGQAGTKADGIEFRQYFEALYEAVVDAQENGLSLEEALATIELDQYRHMGMYDEWFKLNLEGVYKLVAAE
jgi:glyoxylase-like metal-dependent hydrolase (beta-lactamase superfamily II)